MSKEFFPRSRNFSTVKEIFHNQKNFLQSRKFSEKKLLEQGSFQQIFFPQSRKFSANKDFPIAKTFFANNDQKGSLKGKSLDPFNTKSYAKIFLTL